MWRNPPSTPESQHLFQEWIISIYDDAASYALKQRRLPVAEAVNDAIVYTVEELRLRNAPTELIAEIETKLKRERRSLMFNLASQHGMRPA